MLWGGPLEIIGWIVAGLLVVLLLVCIVAFRKKAAVLDALRVALDKQNEQSDENAIESSLKEKRKK